MSQSPTFILICAVVLLLLWAINMVIPISSKTRKILNVMVMIAIIISLVKIF